MAKKISRQKLKKIERQITQSKDFKEVSKNVVEIEFLKIRQKFLSEFDNNPITKEIGNGPESENISETLGGYGNLFTFIGFEKGSDPITPLRDLLSEYKIDYNVSSEKIRARITIPTKKEVERATPMPWAEGRSWASGMESNIPGFGSYMNTRKEKKASRSGKGIQTKNNYGRKFQPKPYIISALREYEREVRQIERKPQPNKVEKVSFLQRKKNQLKKAISGIKSKITSLFKR